MLPGLRKRVQGLQARAHEMEDLQVGPAGRGGHVGGRAALRQEMELLEIQAQLDVLSDRLDQLEVESLPVAQHPPASPAGPSPKPRGRRGNGTLKAVAQLLDSVEYSGIFPSERAAAIQAFLDSMGSAPPGAGPAGGDYACRSLLVGALLWLMDRQGPRGGAPQYPREETGETLTPRAIELRPTRPQQLPRRQSSSGKSRPPPRSPIQWSEGPWANLVRPSPLTPRDPPEKEALQAQAPSGEVGSSGGRAFRPSLPIPRHYEDEAAESEASDGGSSRAPTSIASRARSRATEDWSVAANDGASERSGARSLRGHRAGGSSASHSRLGTVPLVQELDVWDANMQSRFDDDESALSSTSTEGVENPPVVPPDADAMDANDVVKGWKDRLGSSGRGGGSEAPTPTHKDLLLRLILEGAGAAAAEEDYLRGGNFSEDSAEDSGQGRATTGAEADPVGQRARDRMLVQDLPPADGSNSSSLDSLGSKSPTRSPAPPRKGGAPQWSPGQSVHARAQKYVVIPSPEATGEARSPLREGYGRLLDLGSSDAAGPPSPLVDDEGFLDLAAMGLRSPMKPSGQAGKGQQAAGAQGTPAAGSRIKGAPAAGSRIKVHREVQGPDGTEQKWWGCEIIGQVPSVQATRRSAGVSGRPQFTVLYEAHRGRPRHTREVVFLQGGTTLYDIGDDVTLPWVPAARGSSRSASSATLSPDSQGKPDSPWTGGGGAEGTNSPGLGAPPLPWEEAPMVLGARGGFTGLLRGLAGALAGQGDAADPALPTTTVASLLDLMDREILQQEHFFNEALQAPIQAMSQPSQGLTTAKGGTTGSQESLSQKESGEKAVNNPGGAKADAGGTALFVGLERTPLAGSPIADAHPDDHTATAHALGSDGLDPELEAEFGNALQEHLAAYSGPAQPQG